MSEVAILGIQGEVEEIVAFNGEPYAKLKCEEGYWHIRQFMKKINK